MKDTFIHPNRQILSILIFGLILLVLTTSQPNTCEFRQYNRVSMYSEITALTPPEIPSHTFYSGNPSETNGDNVQHFTDTQPTEPQQMFNPTLRGIGPANQGISAHPADGNNDNNVGGGVAVQPVLEHHSNGLQVDQDLLTLSFPPLPQDDLYTERPPLYPVPWAPTPYDHFYFSRPITADRSGWLHPDYRYGGVFFPGIVHTGVDLQAKMQTPILAAASGRVTWAGYGASTWTHNKDDPYGLAVIIRHDFGWQGKNLYTLYAHFDQVDVASGQYVETGTRLGLSGRTGKTTGPHLHFEVLLMDNGRFRSYNPELWLVPPQGWGVLAGRVMHTGGLLLEGHLVTVRSLETNKTYRGHTYHRGPVNSDPYYQENLVISDIPAGLYEIRIDHLGRRHLLTIEIHPGQVTYFTFLGRGGFGLELPPAPGEDFVPKFSP